MYGALLGRRRGRRRRQVYGRMCVAGVCSCGFRLIDESGPGSRQTKQRFVSVFEKADICADSSNRLITASNKRPPFEYLFRWIWLNQRAIFMRFQAHPGIQFP